MLKTIVRQQLSREFEAALGGSGDNVGTVVTTLAEYRQVELLIDEGNGADALDLVAKLVQNDPANRRLQLYSLLTQIIAFGPEPFEAEIDRVRPLTGLPDPERAIITKILRHGFESANRKGDQGKAWAYQRSLRRWVAGLPSDRPLSALRLDEAARKKAPPASLTAIELATLRNVFSAERDDERAGAGRRILRFGEMVRNNMRPMAALRCTGATVLDRAAITFEAISGGWLDKIAAARDAGIFRNMTERMSSPSLNRTAARLGLIACAVITGAGVSVIAMKFGGWTNEKPRIATGPPQAPVAREVSVPVLEPIDSPSPESALALDRRPSKLSAPHSRTDVRNPGKIRQAHVLAVPQGDREKKPRDSSLERRLVFQAMQTIGLRDEPRYGAPKGPLLERGARLILMERNGSWLKVRSEATGSIGYVRREFVAPAAPDS